jgi:hypothetical protein
VDLDRCYGNCNYNPTTSCLQICSPFTVHCAQYLQSGVILAGTNSGAIAVFENGKLRQVVPAHKDLGSRAVAGVPSTRGLRCLCLSGDKRTLISGGADGRSAHCFRSCFYVRPEKVGRVFFCLHRLLSGCVSSCEGILERWESLRTRGRCLPTEASSRHKCCTHHVWSGSVFYFFSFQY